MQAALASWTASLPAPASPPSARHGHGSKPPVVIRDHRGTGSLAIPQYSDGQFLLINEIRELSPSHSRCRSRSRPRIAFAPLRSIAPRALSFPVFRPMPMLHAAPAVVSPPLSYLHPFAYLAIFPRCCVPSLPPASMLHRSNGAAHHPLAPRLQLLPAAFILCFKLHSAASV
jgi:hypothetical protein